ncbi:hypothetical protein [Halobacillus sp. H74]|uniref:hypothetical protein n=1 Tax=Halobacillus sp. H74 TaxID=3457436 RepID=UPI003FCC8775
MMVLGIVLIPFFLFAVFIFFQFSFGKAGKTKEGKKILNASYGKAAPIYPIGWLLVEMYHRFIDPLSFSVYRDAMWVLILVTFIIIGFSLFRSRKAVLT